MLVTLDLKQSGFCVLVYSHHHNNGQELYTVYVLPLLVSWRTRRSFKDNIDIDAKGMKRNRVEYVVLAQNGPTFVLMETQ
jgi:hypothetical protein